jgi:hypothetical protein
MGPDQPGRCGKWVGPVWKTGGETCVCKLRADHADGQFGADHECNCGAWFVDSVARLPAAQVAGK